LPSVRTVPRRPHRGGLTPRQVSRATRRVLFRLLSSNSPERSRILHDGRRSIGE
jgi:hypothetical protein